MRSLVHQLRRAGALIAGGLALALLLLLAQPHQHATAHPERSDCVACTVAHLHSTAAAPTTPSVAPLLLVTATITREPHQPPLGALLPEPRAQGPPQA